MGFITAIETNEMDEINTAVLGSPSGEESNGRHHPCRLVVPKWRATEWATSPLPSRGPRRRGIKWATSSLPSLGP